MSNVLCYFQDYVIKDSVNTVISDYSFKLIKDNKLVFGNNGATTELIATASESFATASESIATAIEYFDTASESFADTSESFATASESFVTASESFATASESTAAITIKCYIQVALCCNKYILQTYNFYNKMLYTSSIML